MINFKLLKIGKQRFMFNPRGKLIIRIPNYIENVAAGLKYIIIWEF